MITKDAIPAVLGHTVYDSSHKKLGKIRQVYVDESTGEPEWMTVNTGMFGSKETFVPLEPAEMQGDDLVVPFQKEQLKDAPTVETEAEGRLSEDDEIRLYEHYGMSTEHGTASGTARSEETRPPA